MGPPWSSWRDGNDKQLKPLRQVQTERRKATRATLVTQKLSLEPADKYDTTKLRLVCARQLDGTFVVHPY